MSRERFVTRDLCALTYETAGDGVPVLWQHGLGANAGQPAEVFPALPGFRRFTLECRGHGDSVLGDVAHLSIAQFTEDAAAFLDRLQLDKVVVGGISLGAAIALRLAALHPERVRGLILARPAWVDGPSYETQAAYAEVAQLLERYGAEEGARRFEASPRLAAVAAVSPDNASSLRWFFSRPGAESTIALLSRIPRDCPGVEREMLGRITAPTLIVACAQDYVHPLEYGRRLHSLIPDATLQVITSKTVNRQAYVAEFKAAVADFLARFFNGKP